MDDNVNHPSHYTSHPSGVECIQITEHFNFNIGNAIKYLWREGLKANNDKDLEKAAWYINREIDRRKRMKMSPTMDQASKVDETGSESVTEGCVKNGILMFLDQEISNWEGVYSLKK